MFNRKKNRSKELSEVAEATQRRFTVSVLALPKPDKRPAAYGNIGATGAVHEFVDDTEEFESYVERLSNLPASFPGIPENRARNLVRKLDQFGAKVELVPEAAAPQDGAQPAYGVTITALPRPDRDPARPPNLRVVVCYSEYAKVDARVARLALLDLPASVEGLEREDAEEMIARIREVGGAADLVEP